MLDPRIAYVMTNMMEGVINNGLGYTAVRLRGFTAARGGQDRQFARRLVRGIYVATCCALFGWDTTITAIFV